MLKFCEFLHRIRVIFYLRFRPLDVPRYAFGTKNEDFRSKSPYPLSAFEGSSSFLNLSYPLALFQLKHIGLALESIKLDHIRVI